MEISRSFSLPRYSLHAFFPTNEQMNARKSSTQSKFGLAFENSILMQIKNARNQQFQHFHVKFFSSLDAGCSTHPLERDNTIYCGFIMNSMRILNAKKDIIVLLLQAFGF